ncbi:hypothetical protein PYW07_011439 [Mythimna separata]|uniref:Serpin domain-containing protein n=1 Tax=Mythimna separata TaxID=271217 RepID=A0AAD7YA26_MYTSE|nr:hypothetical protein PYW07_011439 [Mythimna separata]
MRAVILLVSIAISSASTNKRNIVTVQSSLDDQYINPGSCGDYTNVIEGYRDAMYNFTIETYKQVAPRGTYQFVMSPLSMWITLAAMAEGADYYTQNQLFELLRIPRNQCIRHKYYQLATSRYSLTPDAAAVSKRALVIDEGVITNPVWHNFVTQHRLLDVLTAPLKYNPAVAAGSIRQAVYANFPRLDLRGNSVLIDTMDYNGLWNTAFADAVVKRAPFYSISGEHIGAVDLMTVKRHGKIGYVPSIQAKILELPIGVNNQYSMIIALVVGRTDIRPVIEAMRSTILSNVLASLKETKVPIDIAVPQFKINSELDAKVILEDLGVTSLWTDPEATRSISSPPALLSSYVQRATLTLNKHGINPPPITAQLRSFGPPTSPEDFFFSEFIADRPFMFGLFDTETHTCLISTMYTQPTYPN